MRDSKLLQFAKVDSIIAQCIDLFENNVQLSRFEHNQKVTLRSLESNTRLIEQQQQILNTQDASMIEDGYTFDKSFTSAEEVRDFYKD